MLESDLRDVVPCLKVVEEKIFLLFNKYGIKEPNEFSSDKGSDILISMLDCTKSMVIHLKELEKNKSANDLSELRSKIIDVDDKVYGIFSVLHYAITGMRCGLRGTYGYCSSIESDINLLCGVIVYSIDNLKRIRKLIVESKEYLSERDSFRKCGNLSIPTVGECKVQLGILPKLYEDVVNARVMVDKMGGTNVCSTEIMGLKCLSNDYLEIIFNIIKQLEYLRVTLNQ